MLLSSHKNPWYIKKLKVNKYSDIYKFIHQCLKIALQNYHNLSIVNEEWFISN